MDRDVTDAKQGIGFGPFRLFAAERLLKKRGVRLRLGSRALDILILLVERAGEVVSKKELIERAWPGLTVDESCLRVHISGLRKALGEGRGGARYVTNIPSRGYCFVAPIAHPAEPKTAPATASTGADHAHSLPSRLKRMVGRDETVQAISEQLAESRFVTVHGPGGIGKTTVALAVAHAQLAAFDGAVCFLDLGPLSDARLLPGALASALGLLVHSSDPTASLINFLRDRRMLLILDSCEHVIETAATLAERIFQEAPQVSILATSREALRVEGEQVYRLSALDSPPEDAEPTAAQVLSFPATHLFVERAAAGGHAFALTDADAPVVAEICRKLDGIALAIELAAGRMGTHGLRETAALLDNRLRLLWHGRRTALPRHQTLNATLDWSYDLITEPERTVLRRLSVFVGTFTLQAAQAVAADDTIDSTQVVEALAQLVAKSLVSLNAGETRTRYRLLDTTRAYAHAKLVDSGETEAVARRHAVHYRDFVERANRNSSDGGRGDDDAVHAEHLGNIRAALEWSFSDRGDAGLGVRLAAMSARPLLELSLLSECRHWVERALAADDAAARDARCEMELLAALGHSLMFTKGNSERAHAALERSLELAERLGDRFNQFRLLCRLHMYHLRTGNFGRELAVARRADAVAVNIADPAGIAAAHALLGVSHHLVGNQHEARNHLEASLRAPAAAQRVSASHFAFHRNPRIALARTLWLQGCPDQAVQAARQAVEETAALRDSVTLCIALIWGVSVFHWIGDWTAGEEYTERLLAHAGRYSLGPHLTVGIGLKGEILVRRGEIDRGVDLLRDSLVGVHADRYGLYASVFNCTLAEGLAMTGHLDQALAVIDDTLVQVESNGTTFDTPELLRIRGELLAQMSDDHGAEDCFRRSIALADRQSALSWRLRAAMSLARLRHRPGRGEDAHEVLAETYGRFNEGFDTTDLMAAKLLLDGTGQSVA